MISGLHSSTYEVKLLELNLDSLAHRHEWSDMIQTYKIIHGVDNVVHSRCFTLVESGDNNRLTRHTLWLDIRGNFYSKRVINKWNSCPVM